MFTLTPAPRYHVHMSASHVKLRSVWLALTRPPLDDEFFGQVADLLLLLWERRPDDPHLPITPRDLGMCMTEVAPVLRQVGWTAERSFKNGYRVWRLCPPGYESERDRIQRENKEFAQRWRAQHGGPEIPGL